MSVARRVSDVCCKTCVDAVLQGVSGAGAGVLYGNDEGGVELLVLLRNEVIQC